MRRRRPVEPEPEPGDPSAEDVPEWVLWAGRQNSVMAELRARKQRAAMTEDGDYFTVMRHQRADAEAWCAERGISAQRSIYGNRDPSPEEIAAGCTRGAGAHWERRLRDEAKRR